MSRRTLIVPLLALACTLAPSELSSQVTPLRDVFRISPQSYGSTDPGRYEPHLPAAAVLADGTFVVAWEERIWKSSRRASLPRTSMISTSGGPRPNGPAERSPGLRPWPMPWVDSPPQSAA